MIIIGFKLGMQHDLSHAGRTPTFCIYIYENKSADQLNGKQTADQHLCFRCVDTGSITYLVSKQYFVYLHFYQ